MKTNVQFVVLSLAACVTFACAESNEGAVVPPDKITTDTGVIVPEVSVDTGALEDAGADTSAQDAPSDAFERCVYPATETKPCGKCGTTSRFCLPDGIWTGFTGCTGELVDSECAVGDKRTEDCGNCGKRTDFCDTKTCTFTEGFCAGEGPCAEGDEETTRASCVTVGEIRTRTCDNKCQWSDFSACDIPRGWVAMETPSFLIGRQAHTAVWTGTRMIVWGGYNGVTSPYYQNDGGSYDPATNKWTPIASTTLPIRREHVAVWTGSKMIVWGGRNASTVYNTGAVYDPATDTWADMPVAPLTARLGSAAAWSPATGEMLVWGGCTGTTCASVASDGAAYNPSTNTWTKLSAAPISARGNMVHAFVNGELIVFAGSTSTSAFATDGARYNPSTGAWTKFTPPAGSMVPRHELSFTATTDGIAMYGGRTSTATSGYVADGLIYTPGVGLVSMAPLADTDFSPSAKRHFSAMWQHAGKVYLFSGVPLSSADAAGGFAAYDLATGKWSSPSTKNVLGPRTRPTVVWTGTEVIIWGGAQEDFLSPYYNNGGIWRP